MMKVERSASPPSLAASYKQWGKTYKQYLANNPTSNYFYWHNRYEEIENALFLMTDNHCSFCDIQRLKQSGATIEHFQPKKKFPLLAYVWENLFYCCGNCQKKNSSFNRRCKPLKPDHELYNFDNYFIIIETVEEIFLKPNPARLPNEQARASETIKLYRLNQYGRPEARKAELEDFRDDIRLGKIKAIENYSYRFILN